MYRIVSNRIVFNLIVLYCIELNGIVLYCIVLYCIDIHLLSHYLLLIAIAPLFPFSSFILSQLFTSSFSLCLSLSLSLTLLPSLSLSLSLTLTHSLSPSPSVSLSLSLLITLSLSLSIFFVFFINYFSFLRHFFSNSLQISTATIGLHRCTSAPESQRRPKETVRARYELFRTHYIFFVVLYVLYALHVLHLVFALSFSTSCAVLKLCAVIHRVNERVLYRSYEQKLSVIPFISNS